jgi:DNA-binding transcriptional LysR family regulator
VLVDYADRPLDLAQEARDALQESVPRGPFRLGAMESRSAIRLPEPLSEFHRRYDGVKLDLHTGTIAELSAGVTAGDSDAALVSEPVPDGPYEKTTIYNEELAIVAGADQSPIRSPRDVQDETILAFEHGCPYRLRMQQWFARAGVLPARIVEMSS